MLVARGGTYRKAGPSVDTPERLAIRHFHPRKRRRTSHADWYPTTTRSTGFRRRRTKGVQDARNAEQGIGQSESVKEGLSWEDDLTRERD